MGGGEPTAVILKAALGYGQLMPVEDYEIPGGESMGMGLDEAVRSKLRELMQAWSRRKPRVGAVSGLGP